MNTLSETHETTRLVAEIIGYVFLSTLSVLILMGIAVCIIQVTLAARDSAQRNKRYEKERLAREEEEDSHKLYVR